ncbi:MAG: O-antigen ligase family protein [Chloroflexi bacterium]|nr:O-antigen ligase family protein [Chloroflexota bacterium]
MSDPAIHLIERGLAHRQGWVRALTLIGLLVAVALPMGAVLGLLGGLYGMAALLGLAMGLLILRSLTLGLLAVIGIICLLPFAALPIDIGFSPTFLDLALGAVFFVWIARLVSHQEPGLIADSPTPCVLAFAILAVVSFISGLSHAPLTPNVARHFIEILLSILIFWLVINVVRSRDRLRLLVGALIVGGFIAALIGVLLYVMPRELAVRLLSLLRVVRYPTGPDVLRYIEDNPELALRATSTSVDPNVLGGLLIIVTSLALPHLLARRPILPRKLVVVMTATMALCLVLTFSRSSLVGLGVAAFLLGLLRWRRILWIGLAFVLLLFILPPARVYVTHLIEGILLQDLATQMRLGEYSDALMLIGRYPWFGVGFAGTPDIDTYLGVSSVYLLIGEEMGLVGLGTFVLTLGIFVVHFLTTRKYCPPESDLEPILYGCGVALMGAMVAGVLDHYLFNLDFPHAATLLWLLIGLGTVSIRLVRDQALTSRSFGSG